MSRLETAALAELGAAWDDLVAPGGEFGLLQHRYFSDPAAVERDSLVVHRQGQPLFLLPLAPGADGWISHPQAFAAGLIPLSGSCPADVWPAVQAVAGALPGDRLTLRLKPSTVAPEFADHESGAWRMLPAEVVRSDAIMVLDLSAEFEPSSRRRRALAKAAKNGLTARPVHDEDELRTAWGCVATVYEHRGLAGLLPVERVASLVALPGRVADVLAVEVAGTLIGAALGYRLGNAYRLPVYAVLDQPDATGGTEAVILAAAELARARGCGALDLGTSTDPRHGRTVPGIAGFKAEMGARPRPVEHLVVDLAAPPPP